MIFDYQEMIKKAVETGQPVMGTYPPSSCYGNALVSVSKMTLDTTATVAPSSRYYHDYQASLEPKIYTRAQLKSLIAEWSASQQSHNSKDGIALAGKDSFSSAFTSAFSVSNLTNIYGLDDDLIKAAVFEALLEREASRQFASDSNADLRSLLISRKARAVIE